MSPYAAFRERQEIGDQRFSRRDFDRLSKEHAELMEPMMSGHDGWLYCRCPLAARVREAFRQNGLRLGRVK